MVIRVFETYHKNIKWCNGYEVRKTNQIEETWCE